MPSRRRFLQHAPALAAGALALTEADVRRTPVPQTSVPEAPRGMPPVTVAEVTPFWVGAGLFVRVRTSEGVAGWGEADRAGAAPVVARLIEGLAEMAVGRDVFAAEPLWTDLYYRSDDMGRGGLLTSALSGIDMALWDARGKLLGVPVYQLLGGAFRDRVALYGSFSRDDGENTPADMARIAERFVEMGYKAVKARMDIRQYDVDPDPDPTFPSSARSAPPSATTFPLYVDANNGYSAARAIEVGKRLYEEFGVEVFEEPVGYTNYADLAEVARALTGIQVAAGEHEYTRWQFRELITRGHPDVLNPDLLRSGGLTEGKKIAALAEAFDLPIAVHSTRPTLGTAAHLHFTASVLNADRPQEHSGPDKAPELWDLFENRLEAEDGTLAVPQTPGLGLAVNEAAMERAAREG